MVKKAQASELKFAVIAADTVLFTIKDNQLLVRLMRVNSPPFFINVPGLPGGLIAPKETAEEAAIRHIEAKTGIKTEKRIYVEQLYTFSKIKRDPRGRVVAVSYLGLVPWDSLSISEQEDSDTSYWRPISRATNLAYDHDEILSVAIDRLRSRIVYTTLIGKLMSKEFTLTELEQAYESILHADLDKRNFRKKILKLGILNKLKVKRVGKRSRPASLYEFKSIEVKEIEVI